MKNGLKAAHMFCSLLDYSLDIYVLSYCLSFHVIREHSHICHKVTNPHYPPWWENLAY